MTSTLDYVVLLPPSSILDNLDVFRGSRRKHLRMGHHIFETSLLLGNVKGYYIISALGPLNDKYIDYIVLLLPGTIFDNLDIYC